MKHTIVGFKEDADDIQKFSKHLNCSYEYAVESNYPDGEIKCDLVSRQLSEVRVIVFMRMRSGRDDLLRLLILIGLLRQKNAYQVDVCIPYLPYGRARLSAGIIVRSIMGSGVNMIYTIDIHQPIEGITSISSASSFADCLPRTIVVGPDLGAKDRVARMARHLQTSSICASKSRGSEVHVSLPLENLPSIVILYDDIISTGETINRCVEALVSRGVQTIYICVTHLVGEVSAVNKSSADVRIYTSDSLKKGIISCSKLFAIELQSSLNGEHIQYR